MTHSTSFPFAALSTLLFVACSGNSIGTPGGPGLGAHCSTTTDCGGRTPMCVGGSCVECVDTADCGGEVCRDGLCYECQDNADCGGGDPFCIDNRCRECNNDGDCGAGQVCTPRNQCETPCTTSAMCMGDRNICLTDAMSCVECASESDCPTDEPFCMDGGRCRECRSYSDCGASQPFCVNGECRECVQNTDCPAGQACDPDLECQGG